MSPTTRFDSLRLAEPAALALRLTAIELLLRPMGPGWIRAPLLLVAALSLISTPVLLSPKTWYAAAGLIAARIAFDWPLADNHIYLLGYWCLAIALAAGRQAPDNRLADAARLLLGLAFAFAVLWKAVLSPDYLGGRFFTVTLLTDPRFEDVAKLVGGLSDDALATSRAALAPLPEGAELAVPRSLALTPSLARFVQIATWGTLVLEALVAVAFLNWSRGPMAMGARHLFLILFCLITYAVAPVAGFGWLLLAMGCALCREDQHLLRATYIAAWFVVLFYGELQWISTLAGLDS